MKDNLKILLMKLFYKMGYYPPTKILSPKQFKEQTDRMTVDRQYRKLRRLSEYISQIGDQKYYNQLLKIYVPNWDLKFDNSTFLNVVGLGHSSFSSFRKLDFQEEILFEKVYFHSFLDLKKNLWFQENILPFINDKIKTSKIKHTYSSDLISIVYFEFLKLNNTESLNKKVETVLNLSKELYHTSIDNIHKLEAPPTYVTDYKKHYLYKIGTEALEKRPSKIVLDLDNLSDKADSSLRVFTHGDLFINNAFTPNILMDWDNFGLFPIGFDIAFIYRFILWNNIEVEPIKDWIYKNYKGSIKEEDWGDFERNTYFFLYVFSITLFIEGKHQNLETFLLHELTD